MSFSLLLLHLAGATMLLVWAVRMVRTGVERAHGAELRALLRRSRGGMVREAGAGALIALLLQSSTAVAVLATGFAASGAVSTTSGLAMLLGADLGSALVVRILSFDLAWLVPVLLIAGGLCYLRGVRPAVRRWGRVLMGVGFVLLSLRLIGEATLPLRESILLPVVLGYLSDDYVTAFLIGAALAWLMHSSVAFILLVMSLALQGSVPVELGISLMLGANLGAGLIAVGLTRAEPVEARRIPMGNLIFRGVGSIAALIAAHNFELPLHLAGEDAAARIVALHVVFNLALLVFCAPLAGPMARLLARLMPTAASGDIRASRVSALDRSVLGTPARALACGTQELLRVGETLELMLRPVMELYETGDPERIRQVQTMDKEVNQSYAELKLYLAELTGRELGPEDARRTLELANFAINLEHVGDIIARGLMPLAEERAERRLSFSREGWRELCDLHDRVTANMRLAMNVLVSGDHDSARRLVEEKETMRSLERSSHSRHIARLRSGSEQSIETSGIHLETVRAFKEINSLMTTVAYPILSKAGDLLESRLAHTA